MKFVATFPGYVRGQARFFLVLLCVFLISGVLKAQIKIYSKGAKIHVNTNTKVALAGELLVDSATVIQNAGVIGHTQVLKNYGNIELSGSSSSLTIDSVLYLEKGKIALNGNSLVIFNKDTAAIQRNDGYLVSENSNWGKVRWHIQENTGRYLVPFFNDSLKDVSMELIVKTPGQGLGWMDFATYATNENNEPQPPEIVYYANASNVIKSNSALIADRFWLTQTGGYSDSPLSSLKLNYSEKEISGINNIEEDKLLASRLNERCWEYIIGTTDFGDNSVRFDSVNDYSVWMVSDSLDMPQCHSGLDCGDAIPFNDSLFNDYFLMDDSVIWMKFSASKDNISLSFKKESPMYPFALSRVVLYGDSCLGQNVLAQDSLENGDDMELNIKYEQLTIGDQYYLKIVGNPSHFIVYADATSSGSNKTSSPNSTDSEFGQKRETDFTQQNISVKIYPNPAQHILNVECRGLDGSVRNEIRTYNLLNHEVSRKVLQGFKTTVELEDLPNGIYLYRIVSGEANLHNGKLFISK